MEGILLVTLQQLHTWVIKQNFWYVHLAAQRLQTANSIMETKLLQECRGGRRKDLDCSLGVEKYWSYMSLSNFAGLF